MVRRVVLRVLIVLLFLLSAGSTASPTVAALGDDGAESVAVAGTTATAGASGPIIIDHTCTDLNQIPDYWIEQAKQLTFHIAYLPWFPDPLRYPEVGAGRREL